MGLSGSLRAHSGTVILGVEDGCVSVTGLVLGVATVATSAHVVLLAGLAGAAAAATSMACGQYLSDETEHRAAVAGASWMLAASAVSAALPALPFAFFALAPARIIAVCLSVVLLILLGLGRAHVADSSRFRTIAETVGIAALAALAAVGISLVANHA